MNMCYHTDVKLYLHVEDLEKILKMIENMKGVRSSLHEILSFGNSTQLVFNSNEYNLKLKNSKDILETEETKEIQKEVVRVSKENQTNVESENNNNNNNNNNNTIPLQSMNPTDNKTPEVSCDSEQENPDKNKEYVKIFNDKCIKDEYDLISEELFKCIYRNSNVKFSEKHKLLMEVLMQAMIYADKMKLNLYKLNLFLSLILMTLHKIAKNVGMKKQKRKNTITYFMDLLNKNTQFGIEQKKSEKEMNPEEEPQLSTDINTQKDLENKGNHVITPDLGNPEMEPKKETEINNNIQNGEQEIVEEPHEKKEIILFTYSEAKHVLKYMFDHVFSMYNMYEYVFLFSPIPFNISFSKPCSFPTPVESLTTKDQIYFSEEETMNTKNITNSYVKEALDVPLFVLEKFYSHIDTLTEKIHRMTS